MPVTDSKPSQAHRIDERGVKAAGRRDGRRGGRGRAGSENLWGSRGTESAGASSTSECAGASSVSEQPESTAPRTNARVRENRRAMSVLTPHTLDLQVERLLREGVDLGVEALPVR